MPLRSPRAVSFLADVTSWHKNTFQADCTGNFNTTALYGLKVTSATPGHVVCDFPVTKRTQNALGNLHGGCIGR